MTENDWQKCPNGNIGSYKLEPYSSHIFIFFRLFIWSMWKVANAETVSCTEHDTRTPGDWCVINIWYLCCLPYNHNILNVVCICCGILYSFGEKNRDDVNRWSKINLLWNVKGFDRYCFGISVSFVGSECILELLNNCHVMGNRETSQYIFPFFALTPEFKNCLAIVHRSDNTNQHFIFECIGDWCEKKKNIFFPFKENLDVESKGWNLVQLTNLYINIMWTVSSMETMTQNIEQKLQKPINNSRVFVKHVINTVFPSSLKSNKIICVKTYILDTRMLSWMCNAKLSNCIHTNGFWKSISSS